MRVAEHSHRGLPDDRNRSGIDCETDNQQLDILKETELNQSRYMRIIQGVFSFVAALFGLATITAGVRVLAGSDPGYIVFRPLLIYNTAMGLAYVVAGVIAWRSFDRGKYAAATIFVLNFLVLGAIGYLYATGSAVAIDSLRAMILRTVVWLVLFLGLAWMSHRNYRSDFERHAQSIIPPEAARLSRAAPVNSNG
jgi:hypothetical protein